MAHSLLPSVAGGLALFFWGFISHGILPFHDMAYERFTNERAVSDVLERHATGSGLYYVPYSEADHTPDRVRAFINVLAPGTEQSLLRQMVAGLLAQVVAVFLGVLLVRRSGPSRYWSWVGRFAILGALIGVSTPVFYWNWFGFPTFYTLVMIGDGVAGWTLAGLAVALLLRQRSDLVREDDRSPHSHHGHRS